jgi:PAS domain-containing protein
MVNVPNTIKADRAENTLRIRLIGSLVLIGAITLLAQVLLQWSIASQQDDAHVVRIAARQSMLSQRISKASYHLLGVGTTEARRDAQDELRESLALFQRAHVGLQHGDNEQGLPGANSAVVRKLFASVESDHLAIVAAAGSVLAASDRPGDLYQAVHRLSEHEAAFLAGMEEIVTQYDSEARQRVGYTRWLGIGFVLVTLAALVLLAQKVFMPAIRRMQGDMQLNEGREAEMEKIFSAGPAALFQVDAGSLAIVRGNGKAEVLMGCSSNEFIGRPISTYFDSRLEVNKTFLQKLRTGDIFDEREVLLVDARHNAVEALASLRQLTHSNQRSYLINITDVTAISGKK